MRWISNSFITPSPSLFLVYADSLNDILFPLNRIRPIKFPGAAHFSLRCGCNNSAENINSAVTSSTSSVNPINTVHAGSGGDGGYQLPIVALSFNFNPPQGVGSLKTPLLTLLDIETLYHEWGHALHSILSRTTFQHLSGTRGPTDFVEVGESHLYCL